MQGPGRTFRFYVQTLETESGEPLKSVTLSKTESHHALHVLRLQMDARVELFDGKGTLAEGCIEQTSRNSVSVQIEKIRKTGRPNPEIEIAFAIPKGKRLDWLLEKTTELGAAVLQPLVFERSVIRDMEIREKKLHRWTGHCVSAAKQCDLNFLPEIRQPLTFEQWCDQPFEGLTIFGDLSEQATAFKNAFTDHDAFRPVRILVGPVGDVTPTERRVCYEAGFQAIHLGHTTLRVETASIALLAATWAMFD